MKKRCLISILIVWFAFSSAAGAALESEKLVKDPLPPAKQVGKKMIYFIISGFRAMEISGTGGYKVVDQFLQRCMVMLRKARENKTLDLVFYRRFKRVLEVLKLTILDAKHDRENILGDHIARVIRDFIYDITGEFHEINGNNRGIGPIAAAVSEELLNLHIYLDTRAERKALIKKLSDIPPPPPPKTQKKKK